MKKIITLFAALLITCALTQAQVLIVKWTFPTGNPTDSIADGGISVNLDKAIHTEGGTSEIDFTKNGATTKSAQATGWDNGSMLKCWVIQVNTQGYENLKLSSKMQSGGNNPGPRDYAVQYRIGEAGDWIDVAGTNIVVANDWTTGVLDSILLPATCYNQGSLYLRWIMTSDTNSAGGIVTSGGINKIDDIYVTGKLGNTGMKDNLPVKIFSVSPNPSNGNFSVESRENIESVSVFNSAGKCVYNETFQNSKSVHLMLGSVQHGTYFLKVLTAGGKEENQKVMIL
jgi:hypothetical protein